MRSVFGSMFTIGLATVLAIGPGPGRSARGDEPATAPADPPKPAVRELKETKERIEVVAFSRDGTLLATGSRDHTVMVWDAATGRAIATLSPFVRRSLPVTALAFSPDGKQLAAAIREGTTPTMIDMDRAPMEGRPGFRARFWVTSAVTPTFRVWDIASKREVLRLETYNEGIRSIGFGRDELVTLGGAFIVRRWRLPDGENTLTLAANRSESGGETAGRFASRFSADLTRVIALCDSKPDLELAMKTREMVLKLWDLPSQRSMTLHTGIIGSYVYALSPNGRRILGFADGRPRLWDFDTGEVIATFDEKIHQSVRFLAYSPDGSRFVTVGDDGFVRVWDAAKGRTIAKFAGPRGNVRAVAGPWGNVRAVAFLPHGLRIASGGANEPLNVWDAEFERRP
ncbi:MAG TPA: hypothetical protein VG406_21035 [Isosphaeraceae bacterium]|jgi:WD40 repeat protein|nr:hypothetical protein [Isosphaeraceae bacterium]